MTAAGDSPARPQPVPGADSSDCPRLEEEKGREVHAEHPKADKTPVLGPAGRACSQWGGGRRPRHFCLGGFASSPSTFFSPETIESLGTGRISNLCSEIYKFLILLSRSGAGSGPSSGAVYSPCWLPGTSEGWPPASLPWGPGRCRREAVGVTFGLRSPLMSGPLLLAPSPAALGPPGCTAPGPMPPVHPPRCCSAGPP